ncbi:MAG: hypothetical protein WC055_16625 [Melioribacteraceae bacterium]
MRKLTTAEKKSLIKELRAEGWTGCTCDNCLLVLAKRTLEWQLKIENQEKNEYKKNR